MKLKVGSIMIDGEGIISGPDGMASFDLLHSKQNDDQVSLCAFDLIEWNGDDYRMHPLRMRKARLERLLNKPIDGIDYNEHFEGHGPDVFAHACRLGCEGIVSKRVDLPYESGRSKRWLKIKNPESPAARRIEPAER